MRRCGTVRAVVLVALVATRKDLGMWRHYDPLEASLSILRGEAWNASKLGSDPL